jgi:hypothetical protein
MSLHQSVHSILLIIIIIISPLQSPTSRHFARSSATRILLCQPSCANRHSTWPEGILNYVYRDGVSTPELDYSRPVDMASPLSLQRANTVCYVDDFSFLPDHFVLDSIPQRTPASRWAILNLWTSRNLSVHISAMLWPVERTDCRLSSVGFVGSTIKRLHVFLWFSVNCVYGYFLNNYLSLR